MENECKCLTLTCKVAYKLYVEDRKIGREYRD